VISGTGRSWASKGEREPFCTNQDAVAVAQPTPPNRVTTLPEKSWNLVRPFSRPGKSWKTAKVMESHGK